jgi:hypothetical protein
MIHDLVVLSLVYGGLVATFVAIMRFTIGENWFAEVLEDLGIEIKGEK